MSLRSSACGLNSDDATVATRRWKRERRGNWGGPLVSAEHLSQDARRWCVKMKRPLAGPEEMRVPNLLLGLGAYAR